MCFTEEGGEGRHAGDDDADGYFDVAVLISIRFLAIETGRKGGGKSLRKDDNRTGSPGMVVAAVEFDAVDETEDTC